MPQHRQPASRVWPIILGLLWLWAIAEALHGGSDPGLVSPEIIALPRSYPWSGVSATIGWTGLYTALAYAFLRRSTTPRVLLALLTFLVLGVAGIGAIGTDHPGYEYVPRELALIIACVLAVALLIRGAAAIVARPRPIDTKDTAA